MIDKSQLWTVMALMGIGSFGLRFLFLGLVGDRTLPEWLQRHLRYTAVAVLPALVSPLVVWPQATGGQIDPLRLGAAAATLVVGSATKTVFPALMAGALVLLAGVYWPA